MTDDLEPPVRIEFASRPGLHQVAFTGPEAMERSVAALNDAMGIVRHMAERVRQTVVAMPSRPSEVEVTFGIKFDVEAGAIIAKTGMEASINVLFRWRSADPQGPPSAGTMGIVRVDEPSP